MAERFQELQAGAKSTRDDDEFEVEHAEKGQGDESSKN